MTVVYVELDSSNVLEWKNKLYKFAATLDAEQRCNSIAVAKQRWNLTYPSLDAIQAFVDSGALVAVAHDSGDIIGYIICVDDRNGKYGGCRCKWIGASSNQGASIYAAMGDIAVEKYGWLWGRVTNSDLHGLMISDIIECESDVYGPDIVTYKRPL